MKKRIVSAVILSMILSIPIAGLAAPVEAEVKNTSEPQQISKAIADMEKEIQALRARLAKLESTKTVTQVPAKPDIKFWGDSRTRWINKHDDALKPFQERIRFGMTKEINDDVAMNIRLMMQDNNTYGSGNNVTDTGTKVNDLNKDTVRVIDANFVHKGLFGTDYVTIGRFSQKYLSQNYWITSNGGIDGIKVGFGGKSPLKINASYANWDVLTQNYIRNAYSVDATYKLDNDTTITGMYLKEVSSNLPKPSVITNPDVKADSYKFDVRGIGIRRELSGDFYFEGDYTKNIAMTKGIGYYYSLGYKEADKKVPGSWGLNLEYRKIQANNHVTAQTGAAVDVTNVKGPIFAAHYVPGKNWVLNGYQGFASKYADTGNSKPNYTRFEAIYSW